MYYKHIGRVEMEFRWRHQPIAKIQAILSANISHGWSSYTTDTHRSLEARYGISKVDRIFFLECISVILRTCC